MLNKEQSMATSFFSHSKQKSLRNIDISLRDLLLEETPLKKFMPYNNSCDGGDADPYATDHFRIYEFKVRKCSRISVHDWTECPFAHPCEKARRRCPLRYNYRDTVCVDFRSGNCSRGDLCEFTHGVFEYWLHPLRYRTEACKDGKNCQRKICFFAHTQRQLRLRVVFPEQIVPVKKYSKEYCQCCVDTISPTSTLNNDLGSLWPPLSPTFSPARSRSQFSNRDSINEINELMRSMVAMAVEDNKFSNMNSMGMSICFNSVSGGSGVGDDQLQQFDMCQTFRHMQNVNNGSSSVNGPDLRWVNDLLT